MTKYKRWRNTTKDNQRRAEMTIDCRRPQKTTNNRERRQKIEKDHKRQKRARKKTKDRKGRPTLMKVDEILR